MANDPAPGSPPGPDPSMDDILASIRRILDEEGPKTAEGEAGPDEGTTDDKQDDVLELDSSMMVAEPSGAEPVAPAVPLLLPPVPAAEAAPPAPAEPIPLAVPMPPPPKSSPGLVAPEAAAAAAGSVGALMRTLASERSTAVHRGGPTLEDLVRAEMRPLLKDWLDTHLAPMVERLVRAEIERVVSRNT